MKILFIASGPVSWASARIRCFWVAPYLNADVVDIDAITEIPSGYDVYIFQKAATCEYVKQARGYGKVILDLCDPVHWFSPKEVIQLLPHIDGITASSEALAVDIQEWLQRYGDYKPVTCIPDRMNMDHYPIHRTHSDVHPVRFVWYGMAYNRVGLFEAHYTLCRLAAEGYQFELTIFDNAPGTKFIDDNTYPIYYVPWDLETENQVIAAHDIAILPNYPGEWGKVKSNNRTLTAIACGVPVVTSNLIDYYYIRSLILRVEERRKLLAEQTVEYADYFDMQQSADEWLDFIGRAL